MPAVGRSATFSRSRSSVPDVGIQGLRRGSCSQHQTVPELDIHGILDKKKEDKAMEKTYTQADFDNLPYNVREGVLN